MKTGKHRWTEEKKVNSSCTGRSSSGKEVSVVAAAVVVV